MLQEIFNEIEVKMQKSIESFRHDLAKVRTGRAHPSMFDGIMAVCYDQETPINQVASITVEDARTLLITPWDKSVVAAIDKAIRNANLDVNPVNTGDVIRVPLPALTEETRKNLVKRLKELAENAKVSVRNARRDANDKIKKMLKNKDISEDDERTSQDKVQKNTDKFVAEIISLSDAKEIDIMKI
ncbi:MAG: ribosome recycling factor [Legionellales bacterium]|nr:MAG: ribosome recycling factor [Legionellales bacterium]